MGRRLLVVVAVAGVAAGGTALAQGGAADPYDAPEPPPAGRIEQGGGED